MFLEHKDVVITCKIEAHRSKVCYFRRDIIPRWYRLGIPLMILFIMDHCRMLLPHGTFLRELEKLLIAWPFAC